MTAPARYHEYCPRCGLTGSRWEGCDDSAHSAGERLYGQIQSGDNESDPRALSSRGSAKDTGGPSHDPA